MTDEPTTEEPKTYPEGEYACVEVLGHVRHIGRYQEVDKFGQKFCQVEPIENEEFQTPVLVGGASIYQFRYCTAAWAFQNAPQTYDYAHRPDPPRLAPPPRQYDLDDEIEF